VAGLFRAMTARILPRSATSRRQFLAAPHKNPSPSLTDQFPNKHLGRDDFKCHHALLIFADQFHGFMNRFVVQLKAILI
jgi:hypothetical protein